MQEIDPSDHIKLIYRIINQMGLKGDNAEECFSESLVTITKAAQDYDPDKGVPVANWLAMNIRYGILNWLNAQHPTVRLLPSVQLQRNPSNGRTELNEVLGRVKTLLTDEERRIILATALGFTGKEIADALGVSPVEVFRKKKKIRLKIK